MLFELAGGPPLTARVTRPLREFRVKSLNRRVFESKTTRRRGENRFNTPREIRVKLVLNRGVGVLNRTLVDADDRDDRGGDVHLEELLIDVVPGTDTPPANQQLGAGTPACWLARVRRCCVDGAVDGDQDRSLAVATMLATCGRS